MSYGANFGIFYGKNFCKHNFVGDICINCLYTRDGLSLGRLREREEKGKILDKSRKIKKRLNNAVI